MGGSTGKSETASPIANTKDAPVGQGEGPQAAGSRCPGARHYRNLWDGGKGPAGLEALSQSTPDRGKGSIFVAANSWTRPPGTGPRQLP